MCLYLSHTYNVHGTRSSTLSMSLVCDRSSWKLPPVSYVIWILRESLPRSSAMSVMVYSTWNAFRCWRCLLLTGTVPHVVLNTNNNHITTYCMIYNLCNMCWVAKRQVYWLEKNTLCNLLLMGMVISLALWLVLSMDSSSKCLVWADKYFFLKRYMSGIAM